MDLTVDILIDELSEHFDAEVKRSRVGGTTIKRAVFFDPSKPAFRPDLLYIAHAADLPLRPSFKSSVFVVCLDGDLPRAYSNDKCAALTFRQPMPAEAVLNRVQDAFDVFDSWESELECILNSNGDVEELLEASFPVVQNPMVVIDAGYHFLAYSSIIDTDESLALYRPDQDGYVKLDYINHCIDVGEIAFSQRFPLIIDYEGTTHASINMFVGDDYIGNVTVSYVMRPFRPGDLSLLTHLVKCITQVVGGQAPIASGKAHVLKSALRDCLAGRELDSATRQQVRRFESQGRQFLCAVLLFANHTQVTVPSMYACNAFESLVDDGLAFHHDHAIVAFVGIGQGVPDEATALELIDEFARKMHLQAGVSNLFDSLLQARQHYRQACTAFEIGAATHPGQLHYLFEEYALRYMALHCFGEFEPSALYPKGLRRLMEHDANRQAKANYLETLSAYLNNNMNLSRTAQALFVHKSSLLSRLKRIEAILDVDLEDPDEQLRIRIALKVHEVSSSSQPEEALADSAGARSSNDAEFLPNMPLTVKTATYPAR